MDIYLSNHKIVKNQKIACCICILHCEHGPALVDKHQEEWWYMGKRHRVDGPAIQSKDGKSQRWYLHGELHRENGPAIIEPWTTQYFVGGMLHRLDGPAVTIPADHYEAWYQYGKLHKEDGPAVKGDYNLEYWYEGKRFDSLEDLQNHLKTA